jgi:acyl-CoA thioesterase-1
MFKLNRKIIIIIAAGLIVTFYLAFCSTPYRHIKNLNSSGTKIVAFGNSITFGTGVSPEQAFPALLQQELGIEVINAGVAGETTEDALKRVDKILAYNPRIVLLEFGGNDFLRQTLPNIIESNLLALIDRLQAGGAMVVLLGMPSWQYQFESKYKAIAKDTGAVYIKNILKGLLTHPDLMADNIHPNAEGHKLIAQKILKVLKPLLKAADRAR